ncbi:MAG: extracellular solute-binding protein [Chloroflexi bacterium]|nr:extracellular solute-binding protein [Chloroflexota bacterium]
MDKRISRREMLTLCGALAAGTVLAACAPQPTAESEQVVTEEQPVDAASPEEEQPVDAAPPEEEVQITYWQGWATETTVQDWQKSEVYKEMTEGFTVEMLVGVREEKQTTAAAAGQLPDVILQFDYVNWFRKGLLMPLDDLVAKSTEIDLDDFVGAIHEASRFDGNLLGIPAIECWNRFGLNVDTSLLEAAGMDASKFPETLDEIYEWAVELTKFDDAGNLLLMGFDPYGEMAGQFQSLVTWWVAVCMGVDFYDNETGEYHFDDPKIMEYVEWATKFYDLMGPDNVAGFRDSYQQWGQAINAQTVVMTVNGYWQVGQVGQENPEVAAVIEPSWPPVPEERRGVKIAHPSPHFASIPTTSKYPEQAFRTIEYITSDDGCTLLYNRIGYLPARASFLETVDGTRHHGLQWWLDTAKTATEFPVPTKDPLSGWNYQQWVVARERIYRHEVGVEEAMTEWQRLATEEYRKQFG